METKTEPLIRTDVPEMVITRILNAPRDLVFRVWTEPEHIKHWWGPKGFTNTISKMEFRPGGIWEFVMHGPDGTDYPNVNEFVEIVRPERIVLKHVYDPVFFMTVTFEEVGNKTKLTIRNRFESAAVFEMAVKQFGAAIGLKQTVDRMEDYIYEKPKGDELVITRELNAPKELVYQAWTQKEHLAKWWGPKGFEIKVSNFDFKPGGTFLYSMAAPDGSEMTGLFVYHEIIPGERVTFVNSFADKDGHLSRAPFSPTWPLEVYNELTFSEKDGKTTVALKGGPIHMTEEERKTFEGGLASMNEGFAGTFAQLEEHLLWMEHN